MMNQPSRFDDPKNKCKGSMISQRSLKFTLQSEEIKWNINVEKSIYFGNEQISEINKPELLSGSPINEN